jgi:hypothetical protein
VLHSDDFPVFDFLVVILSAAKNLLSPVLAVAFLYVISEGNLLLFQGSTIANP